MALFVSFPDDWQFTEDLEGNMKTPYDNFLWLCYCITGTSGIKMGESRVLVRVHKHLWDLLVFLLDVVVASMVETVI